MASGEQSTAGRTSITYVLPGGLRCTYAGERQSYARWIWDTCGGGLALWRIWLRCALHLMRQGHPPHPRLVTAASLVVLRRFLNRGAA